MEKIKTKSSAPQLPFDCVVGTDFEDIKNPFSGETVNCPPDFVAVYDTIKGAEIVGKAGDKPVDKRDFLCTKQWINCGYLLLFSY